MTSAMPPRSGTARLWGLLIRLHRYLGVTFSLLFVVWFASGVVMMYRRMPRLTSAERLHALAPLALDQVRMGAAEAWARFGRGEPPRRVRLAMLLDRPVYRFLATTGTWVGVYADDGAPVTPADSSLALAVAAQLAPGQTMRYGRYQTTPDQWTLSSTVRRLGPLHQIDIADRDATRLYISVESGEAVMKTTRDGRLWGYLGPVVHWLFFTPLRARSALWSNVVIYGSLLGAILCLSGIVVGLYRYGLFRRYRGNRRTPYHGWARWHHLFGLAFGLATFTWIASGMLSMTPWNWSPGHEPRPTDQGAATGGVLDLTRFRLPPATALRQGGWSGELKELEWLQVAGQPYYLVYRNAPPAHLGQWENTDEAAYLEPDPAWPARLLAAGDSPAPIREGFAAAELLSIARAALPNAPVREARWLTSWDQYYYHRRAGGRRLPVYRVQLGDPEESWLYLSPVTGAIVQHEVRRSRLERWVYHGLHSLDFPRLYQSRPLWDAVVASGSLGGLGLSLAGLLLAGRRARRSISRLTVDSRRPPQRTSRAPSG